MPVNQSINILCKQIACLIEPVSNMKIQAILNDSFFSPCWQWMRISRNLTSTCAVTNNLLFTITKLQILIKRLHFPAMFFFFFWCLLYHSVPTESSEYYFILTVLELNCISLSCDSCSLSPSRHDAFNRDLAFQSHCQEELMAGFPEDR